MNYLEEKLKKIALSTAIDLSVKRNKKAPARSARNLIEMANASFCMNLSKKESTILYRELIIGLEQRNAQWIKQIFFQRLGL